MRTSIPDRLDLHHQHLDLFLEALILRVKAMYVFEVRSACRERIMMGGVIGNRIGVLIGLGAQESETSRTWIDGSGNSLVGLQVGTHWQNGWCSLI